MTFNIEKDDVIDFLAIVNINLCKFQIFLINRMVIL